MKILSLFLLLLTLSGCISTMNLSKEDRATTSNSAFVGWSPTAQDRDKSLFIFEIDGKNVEGVLVGVHLDPGKHTIRYECRTGSNDRTMTYKESNKGTDTIDIIAGNMYFLKTDYANVIYSKHLQPRSAVQNYVRNEDGKLIRKQEVVYDEVKRMNHKGCGIRLYTCESGFIYQDKLSKKIICSKKDLNFFEQMKQKKKPLYE